MLYIKKETMRLYAVTDQTWSNDITLKEQVELAIQGGVTFVQLREKKKSKEEIIQIAREIKQITDKYQIPFVINDNVEVALEVGADGVHVGQEDMKAVEARRILGDKKIIGVSVHTVEEAVEAQKMGANYIGVGAVFPTSTKKNAVKMSNKTLQDICQAVDIPVVAIGGIQTENIMELKESGIDGIAVVSAIFSKKDIKQAAKELREMVEQIVN